LVKDSNCVAFRGGTKYPGFCVIYRQKNSLMITEEDFETAYGKPQKLYIFQFFRR